MSQSLHPFIDPVSILVERVELRPRLTVRGVDLDSGKTLSVSIENDPNIAETLVAHERPFGLVLTLTLSQLDARDAPDAA